MWVFAIGIEHSLDVAIDRPHDTDAREHRRAAEIGDEQKRFHCGLPFRIRVFSLGKLGDVGRCVAQGDKLAARPARLSDHRMRGPSPIANGASPFCRNQS
jgi:hypothetical protein